MPHILCLAVRNTADWEPRMEQALGSNSFFSTSLYTAKQTAGTAPMLHRFFSGNLYTQGGKGSKVLPNTKNIFLEWDDTHNPVLLPITACNMAGKADPKSMDTLRCVKPSLRGVLCKYLR